MNQQEAEILNLIERGYPDEAILALYPHLTPEALHRLAELAADDAAALLVTTPPPQRPAREAAKARKASTPPRGRRVVFTALQAVLIPVGLLILGTGFLSTMKGVGKAGGGSFIQAEVITKYAVRQPDGTTTHVVRTALGDTSVKPGVYSDVQLRRPVCLQMVRDRRKGGASRVVGVVPDDLCK